MPMDRIRAEFGRENGEYRREHIRFENAANIEKPRQVKISGILIKSGVCALALALVLTLKLMSDGDTAVSAALDDGASENFEDMGRLKFVELPGIIEVFSGGRLPVGIEYSSHRELAEGSVLCLNVARESQIDVPADCRVKEITPLEGALYRVSLITGSDMEFIYAGLVELFVEEGQKLVCGDTLGTARAENAITIEVNSGGRPQRPISLFNIPAGDKY